jgi:hypothetical protein
MKTSIQKLSGTQLFHSVLLVFGSFLFALILNSFIIHEASHAFGGVLYGCKFEKLIINPFGTGGWRSQCPDPMSMNGRFLQGMGGPIFGLPISIAFTILLWRKRKPILLPLLMSATVVLTANFIGVLDSVEDYPGFIFDYGWMLLVGVQPIIVWLIGILSLVFGVITMNILLPLAGIGPKEPFWKILVLNLSTWPLYLLIRLIYQSQKGGNVSGLLSFLIFGMILSTLTALSFKPIIKFADRFTHLEPVLPSARAVWLAFGLGMGSAVILSLLNPIWIRLS